MIVGLLSVAGRPRAFLLLGLAVLLTASACSRGGEEPPDADSTLPSSIITVPDTAPAVAPADPTTVPTQPVVTTTAGPGREVMAYYDELSALYTKVAALAADMRAANNDWDNRSVTGVSYQATETAMSGLLSRAEGLRDEVGYVDPPADLGLPVEHRAAWSAAGQMADAARAALAGLRSSDTGERRRAALAEFIDAFGRFDRAVGRVVEIIGLGSGFTPSTTVPPTVATAPTTTTTTAPAATTTTAAAATATTEAAETTTTEAAEETTTTEAAETTTTEAAETTTTEAAEETTTTEASGATGATVPPPAGVSYGVENEADRSAAGAKRIWLTVSVEAGTTKDQLARLGRRLAAEYRLSRDYQALLIHFVHFPEEPSPVLGTWTDAPFGNWDRASEASVGDYSDHQAVDRTVEKDWSALPTRAQVDLYHAFLRYRDGVVDPEGNMPPDSEILEGAAQRLDATTSQISEAVRLWEAWIGN